MVLHRQVTQTGGSAMSTKERDGRKVEAIKHLRNLLKPGTTVYSVLRHVSQSGMTRRIDFYTVVKGDIVCISGWIADATGYRRSKNHDGLVVQGCGMDMGFAVVYDLSRTIYPKGFKRKGWRRNNDMIDQDTDGGYALVSRWM